MTADAPNNVRINEHVKKKKKPSKITIIICACILSIFTNREPDAEMQLGWWRGEAVGKSWHVLGVIR